MNILDRIALIEKIAAPKISGGMPVLDAIFAGMDTVHGINKGVKAGSGGFGIGKIMKQTAKQTGEWEKNLSKFSTSLQKNIKNFATKIPR